MRSLGGPSRALATNLYGGTRSSTPPYAEKVRSQVLSLRQIGRRAVFSERSPWQFSPISKAISNLSSGLLTGGNAQFVLRKACFSLNLWTPAVLYGSRKSNCFEFFTSFGGNGVREYLSDIRASELGWTEPVPLYSGVQRLSWTFTLSVRPIRADQSCKRAVVDRRFAGAKSNTSS
jgi:hypothetical protein